MALIRTEFFKLRTQRAMRVLLLVALGLNVVGFLLFAFDIRSVPTSEVGLQSGILQREMLGVGTGTLFVIIFAILGITSEYRHETITWTFLQTPQRYKVMLAKLVTYAIVGALYGVAGFVISTGGVLILLQAENIPLVVPWSTIVKDALKDLGGLSIAATFGFVVGAIIVNQVASIGIIVFESIVAPIATGLGSIGFIPNVGPYFPSMAASAFLSDRRFPHEDFLSPEMGALVVACWLSVLLGAALYLTQRRDIT